MKNKNDRWLSTRFLASGNGHDIDAEKGIILNVSVVTAGEALGHGYHLDSDFVADVVAFGNEKKQGVKARYGHPNMCGTALGTFIGRFKNFRAVDDGGRAIANLYLSNEAKTTPNGDLFSYIVGMAKNEPDMFGTSIVFSMGRDYRYDETGTKIFAVDEGFCDAPDPTYVECKKLHGCDAVDSPAANDGLFSRFANDTIAGQVTEFLDANPEVFAAIKDNPEVMDALANHADKIDEFIEKYEENRTKTNEEEIEMNEKDTKKDEAKALELEMKNDKKEETVILEEAPEAVSEELHEQTPQEIFREMREAFGDEISVEVFYAGGSFADAQAKYNESLKAENEKLKTELNQKSGGTPAEFVETDDEKKAFSDFFSSKK